MRFKLHINGKMLLYILGTTIVVYVSSLSYIVYQLRSNSYKVARKMLETETIEISNIAEQKLNSYMATVSVLAQTFSNFKKITEQNRREMFSKMLYDIINKNTNYLSAWTVWEPLSIDTFDTHFADENGKEYIGNFNAIYYQNGNSVLMNYNNLTDSIRVLNSKVYSQIKNTSKPTITEPYFSFSNKGNKELQTTMIAPIIIEDVFLGVIGVDVSLSYIKQKFSNLDIMGNGKVFIITRKGNFLSHPDTTFYGKSFQNYAPQIENKFAVSQLIKEGKEAEFIAIEPLSGKESLFEFKTIVIGKSVISWALGISVPLDTIYQGSNKTVRFALIIGILSIIFISIVILTIAHSISKPIIKTTKILQGISHGKIKNIEKQEFLFNDEINDMAVSMNNLIGGLNLAARFAEQIGEGDLNADYKLLGENDALGLSLISMQQSLINAKKAEEEKRIEDEKRNWVTHGLAKFGEVIRQHNDNMEKFTMNIVNNIDDYMDVAQIAIYINQQIENENIDNELFELKAAMAYGKPVMIKKIFEKGHELLGRVVDENKTICLENLPDRYVILSPGMQNNKRPTNMLISPLHVNKITYGVIELLSFKEFQPHQIDFIEKLCENIASIVSSVKTNIRTEKLLQQSQNQADELAQHEEEMRQNLEEMEATQEEAIKRQNELKAYIKSVNDSTMIAKLDISGRILDISSSMSVIYGGTVENMKGKFYDAFVAHDKESQENFKEFWGNMIKSGKGKRTQKTGQRNKESWLLESYFVIKKEGFTPKILVVAIDKSKEKELHERLNYELKANNMT